MYVQDHSLPPYTVLSTPKRNPGLEHIGFIPFGGPLYLHTPHMYVYIYRGGICLFFLHSRGMGFCLGFSTKQHQAPRPAAGPASGHEAQHSPGTSGSILWSCNGVALGTGIMFMLYVSGGLSDPRCCGCIQMMV